MRINRYGVVGWIPPPSTDRRTHKVHSLHRASQPSLGNTQASFPFSSLLSWSSELTLDSAWTLPYTLACTAKSTSRADYLRRDLKPARSSLVKSSGCSHAAKWPPFSTLL